MVDTVAPPRNPNAEGTLRVWQSSVAPLKEEKAWWLQPHGGGPFTTAGAHSRGVVRSGGEWETVNNMQVYFHWVSQIILRNSRCTQPWDAQALPSHGAASCRSGSQQAGLEPRVSHTPVARHQPLPLGSGSVSLPGPKKNSDTADDKELSRDLPWAPKLAQYSWEKLGEPSAEHVAGSLHGRE